MTLKETIAEFRASKRAVGHFNVSDSNQLRALAEAARETKLPAMVGLSEGEREFFPIAQVRALVNAYRAEGLELFLNADHTYSAEKAQAAIAAGVDSIVIDGAKLPFDENAALLKQCVGFARGSGREVLVEGELGYIGTSSAVMDALPAGAAVTEEMMTKPEDLKRLVEETGIDLAAPAVGNIHGIVKSGQPKLSIARIQALTETAGVPLVLHGGSGSSDEEFREAVKAGIAVIHINTELRVLYRDSLKQTLEQEPQQTTPYKFLAPSVSAMQAYLAQKMRLFAGQ